MVNQKRIQKLAGCFSVTFLQFTHCFRFFSCIPSAPGPFNLTSPVSVSNSTFTTPLVLEWQPPSPLGQSCGTGTTFQVFLAQSSPPTYFSQVTSTTLSLSLLMDGEWFWTVRAVNQYFITKSEDTFSFVVLHNIN